MFTSVLVANRGEIAVRICKTLRKMGIRSLVTASIPDRRSLAVRTADDWVLLEGYSAAESYLDVEAIIAAARQKGCEAIHPGYGFLSERTDFAERCAAEGIVFIGPPPDVLRALGDKSAARRLAVEHGVPVVPGWDGADDGATLIAKAAELGFPVMLKARGGGGGRGMRPAHDPAELPEAIDSARREAEAAFGDPGLLLEKLVTNAHHVEVQVVADAHGHVIHLGERDCSVQRRRQKLIEETPSPVVDEALRAELTGAAQQLARAVGYVNAGTFEFLVGDPTLSLPLSREVGRGGRGVRAGARPYYFLEVNPRLQVEHPVTEMVTGLDLVELQLRVAASEPLPLTQDDVRFEGHAIEFRINAEDPWNDFRPSSGRITEWRTSSIPRIDFGFAAGDSVPSQYDSLLAKVIVDGRDRESALGRVEQSLGMEIRGVQTNIDLHLAVAKSSAFQTGDAGVGWLDANLDLLPRPGLPERHWVAAAAAMLFAARWRNADYVYSASVWTDLAEASLWLTDGQTTRNLRIRRNGDHGGLVSDGAQTHPVVVVGEDWQGQHGEHKLRLSDSGEEVWVKPDLWDGRLGVRDAYEDIDYVGGDLRLVPPPPLPRRAHAAAEGATAVTAPLAGTIASVRVAQGDQVEAGDLLLTLDAMKMEHRITATAGGTVTTILVGLGAVVREGDVLLELA